MIEDLPCEICLIQPLCKNRIKLNRTSFIRCEILFKWYIPQTPIKRRIIREFFKFKNEYGIYVAKNNENKHLYYIGA